MPAEKIITVRGPIGSFKYLDNGRPVAINGMQLVDLMTQITQLPSDTKAITVEVGSLGGSVPVAKAMRSVLKTLGLRMKITTKQVDDIASAGTIIFGAGQDRIAARGINPHTGEKFKMMVHNTWIPSTSGNADELQAQAAELRMSDQEFVDIYTEDTGISAEAIAPLMKAETFFDADQALALKFATGTYDVGSLQKAAYQPTTTKQAMAKEKKTSAIHALLAALGIETGEKVATAPPADLIGKPLMANGAAAPDGVYTCVGGMITQVAAVPMEQQAPAGAAAAPAAAPASAAPAAAAKGELTEERVLALINAAKKKSTKDEEEEDQDPVDKLAAAIAKAIGQGQHQAAKGSRSFHAPAAYKPENRDADAKEWDRSFKAGEHVAMRKSEPEKWAKLFYAKYGRWPKDVE